MFTGPLWNCISPLQWLVIVHLKGIPIHNVNENVPQSHGSHCSAKVLTVQVVLYKSTAVKALSALFWLWWLGFSTGLPVQVDELPFYQSQALDLEWALSFILFCVFVVVLLSTLTDNDTIFHFVFCFHPNALGQLDFSRTSTYAKVHLVQIVK